jgi:hypothetical protein
MFAVTIFWEIKGLLPTSFEHSAVVMRSFCQADEMNT